MMVIIALIVCVTLLICKYVMLVEQREVHEFKIRKINNEKNLELDVQLTAFVKEFEDYKKRVDTLTLRAGFKL